jgi:hypothetical protein
MEFVNAAKLHGKFGEAEGSAVARPSTGFRGKYTTYDGNNRRNPVAA